MATYQEIVSGMVIFTKYEQDGVLAHVGGADHDIIYGLALLPKYMAPEDVEKLNEFGWSYSEQYDCWYHYV
jgi:hypothetical protein